MTTTQPPTAGPRRRCRINSEPIGSAAAADVTGSMSTSPRLGVVRESMLTDPLLIKAPLGKVRSRGVTVPGPDFTFGNSSTIRDGGVAEALSSWGVPSRREPSACCLDFVALNRDAVRSGLVTSKELSQYRAQRARVKGQKPTTKQREGGASGQLPAVPDVTFGVRNRPPSPMADVLSHHYGRRWMDQQLTRSQTLNHKRQIKPGRAAETRTTLLRKTRCLPVKQTPFRLPQFSQVPAALNTFREPRGNQRPAEEVRTAWTDLDQNQ